jgi:hypothetical protein
MEDAQFVKKQVLVAEDFIHIANKIASFL